MLLDALAPNLKSRLGCVGRQVFERCVAKPRGVRSGQPAQHLGCKLGIRGEIAGALAGFGGKGRTLRELRPRRTGEITQGAQNAFTGETGISRGQSNPAPHIRSPLSRKTRNGASKQFRVSPVDKPPGATQALVERPSLIARQPARRWLSGDIFRPVEEALVEPPTVEGEPGQQRIEPPPETPEAKGKARPHPPDADMDHVSMRIAGTAKEACYPIWPPRRKRIQQCQPHRSALEGEPAQLGIS